MRTRLLIAVVVLLVAATAPAQISATGRTAVTRPSAAAAKPQGKERYQAFAMTHGGNAERGKEIFFKSAGLQCSNCHRIAGVGSTLGPDLSEIGKKYSRAQILESILEPSKSIEPKYLTYLVETTDGKVQTGLLVSRNEREVVLRVVGDKEVRIPAKKVATLVPTQKSLMPDLLLRDLTAEQAADLLEFLASLK